MDNLIYNQQDDRVKGVQQLLRELGYFNHPTNTGFYGDKTLNAYYNFQRDNGLPVKSDISTQDVMTMQDILAKKPKGANSTSTQSSTQNGDNQDITSLEDAQGKAFDPFYDEQLKYNRGLLSNDVADLQGDYNYNQNELQNTYRLKKIAADEASANQQGGNLFSTSRVDSLNDLQNEYNQKSNYYKNKAARAFQKKMMDQEYDYGAPGITGNDFTQTNSTANFLGSTPQFSNTTSGGSYTPLGVFGRQNANKKYYKRKGTQDALQTLYLPHN